MKYFILFFNLSLIASQALEKERTALIQECKILRSDAMTIYTDILHPETAIENAIEAYLEKVIKAEAEKLAKAEAQKILYELRFGLLAEMVVQVW